MTNTPTGGRQVGSHSGKRRAGGAWLWPLLGLLALVIVGLILWFVLDDDDTDDTDLVGAGDAPPEEVEDGAADGDDEVALDDGDDGAALDDDEAALDDGDAVDEGDAGDEPAAEDDDGSDAGGGTTPPPAGPEAACDGGEITDAADLTGAETGSLQGCVVRLDSVTVLEAVSDKLFTIGDPADPIFVSVGEEVPTPGTPVEGQYDINSGNTVSILEGEIQVVASPSEAMRMFEIDEALAQDLADAGYFVLGTSIEKLG